MEDLNKRLGSNAVRHPMYHSYRVDKLMDDDAGNDLPTQFNEGAITGELLVELINIIEVTEYFDQYLKDDIIRMAEEKGAEKAEEKDEAY